MSRTKNQNSKLSFGGLGLEPEEDIKLKEALSKKGVSLKQLQRMLVREWLKSPVIKL